MLKWLLSKLKKKERCTNQCEQCESLGIVINREKELKRLHCKKRFW